MELKYSHSSEWFHTVYGFLKIKTSMECSCVSVRERETEEREKEGERIKREEREWVRKRKREVCVGQVWAFTEVRGQHSAFDPLLPPLCGLQGLASG